MIDIIGACSLLALLASGKYSEPRSRSYFDSHGMGKKLNAIARTHVMHFSIGYPRNYTCAGLCLRENARRASARVVSRRRILAERAFQRAIDFPIARARGAMRTFAEERARARPVAGPHDTFVGHAGARGVTRR
jgi:hypothetical protein